MGYPQFSGQPYMPSPEMYKSYSYGQPQMPQVPQMPTMPQSAQPAQNGGINWVQGEAAAKAWLVAPGASVMLMDSENSVFYIKATDASGMPMPLRVFDYSERTVQPPAPKPEPQPAPQIDMGQYITRQEFETKLAQMMRPAQPIPPEPIKEVPQYAEPAI